MPELPDVTGFQSYIANRALQRRIQSVEVKDERFVKGADLKTFWNRCTGRSITEIHRHGKHLFNHLDTEQWLVMHFGMTGEPYYYPTENNPPRFERVVFRFDNCFTLGIACMRMLGHVTLTTDKEAFIQKEQLGPDALSDLLTENEFVARFADRRGIVKSALMNQSLIAGIGNVYADEILLKAGIDPQTKMNTMTEGTLRKLYQCMRQVLSTAAERGGYLSSLPSDFLIPVRGKKEVTCPLCNTPLTFKKVGGRGTYICPNCQH